MEKESEINEESGPMKSVGFRFWQLFINWQRKVEIKLSPYNLTQPSFSVLAIVGWLAQEHGIVRQKMIVEMSGLPKMQISLILRRLSKNRFVKIKPYKLDRREKLVEIMPEGLELLGTTIPLVEQIDRRYLSKARLEEIKLLASPD